MCFLYQRNVAPGEYGSLSPLRWVSVPSVWVEYPCTALRNPRAEVRPHLRQGKRSNADSLKPCSSSTSRLASHRILGSGTHIKHALLKKYADKAVAPQYKTCYNTDHKIDKKSDIPESASTTSAALLLSSTKFFWMRPEVSVGIYLKK